ncbi:hypothetical protein GCM10010276_74890 [Streptomyces longisporus]|uniref:Uncharacterized protein n=1 Tax=Streptomyces longisporus TaxID=1948 RepID=A0ABP6ADX5_STRLO
MGVLFRGVVLGGLDVDLLGFLRVLVPERLGIGGVYGHGWAPFLRLSLEEAGTTAGALFKSLGDTRSGRYVLRMRSVTANT